MALVRLKVNCITLGWVDKSVLMSNLRDPVHRRAMKDWKYRRISDELNISIQDTDIEQMISLLDELALVRKDEFAGLTEQFRKAFFSEILNNLTRDGVMARPRALKLLMSFHKKYGKFMGEGEALLCNLTVNFDSLLDQAIEDVYGSINYGVMAESTDFHINNGAPSLLKLHGSFNWSFMKNPLDQLKRSLLVDKRFESSREMNFVCLPPSVYKQPSLQEFPYKEIWDAARENLKNCDIFRIIGCSLRKEDWPLISLIFTTQVISTSKFSIELVVPDSTAEEIRDAFPFLGKIQPSSFTSKNVFWEWISRKYEEISANTTAITKDVEIERLLYGG